MSLDKVETREVIPYEWVEPPIYNYVMGVDTYNGFSSICVMRQHDNFIEYIQSFTDESEYEREVERLAEYYKCIPIRDQR